MGASILIAEPAPVYADHLLKMVSHLGYRTVSVDRASELIMHVMRGDT